MAYEAKKVHVESSDAHASILAAMKRIEEVPPTQTLIDLITDDDWKDAEVSKWNFCVGSQSIEDADQLDDADEVFPSVA